MNKNFKKEKVYPNEAFVQEAIELYFSGKGYVIKTKEQVDLELSIIVQSKRARNFPSPYRIASHHRR